MNLRRSAFVLCAVTLAAPLHAADSRAEIRRVVNAFQAAIVAHDGAALTAMFLPEHGAWLSLMDDDSYRQVKARHAGLPRIQADDFRKFCDFVSKADKPIEEKFSNVRVEANDTVGVVYFDYVFLVDGKPTNHGDETWQLVKADGRWKISSMLYSVTLDTPATKS
jgi:SnoaL-like domain